MANAPAPPPPKTAIQRAGEQADTAMSNMLLDVDQHKGEIESFLRVFGSSYELFVAGLRIFLIRQRRENLDFFLRLEDTGSFIESLLRIAANGLVPDGKEAAIAVYAGVAQAMFMRDGFVKVLWRTGLIKSINDQVVTTQEYEAGRFVYEEGDQGFIRHQMDLKRKDTDEVIAAYCVIRMATGEDMREVVPKDELDKIAKMSKSPARKAWAHQMHRKAAIRRIMGKMPRHTQITQLLNDDEKSYDLDRVNERDSGAPPIDDLASNRPIRRKKGKPTEPLTIEQGADLKLDPMTIDQAAEVMEIARQEEHEEDLAQRRAETDFPLEDAVPSFVLTAIIKSTNGPQQYPEDQAELWFGDINDKMKRLTGDGQAAFWRANRGYIEEAGRNGHTTLAMKLLATARDLGLEGDTRG